MSFSNRPASARGTAAKPGQSGQSQSVKRPGGVGTSSGISAAALENETEELKRERPHCAAAPRASSPLHLPEALHSAFDGPILCAALADATVSKDLRVAIAQARNAKGLTQKQLATQLNMQPQVINEYESGKAIPNNQVISKIERALGAKLPRAKK